jgi:hypothetical protein
MGSKLGLRSFFVRILGNFSQKFPQILLGMLVCKLLILFIAVTNLALGSFLDLTFIVVDLLMTAIKYLADRYEFPELVEVINKEDQRNE